MQFGTLFKLARRNIWRNKRRTLITISSIAFAVLFAVAMQSFQKGTWDNMLQSVVESQTGYIQIVQKDYWESPTINKAFAPDRIIDTLLQLGKVDQAVGRLQSFALAAEGERTRAVMVTGLEPEAEQTIMKLQEKMDAGKYWSLESPTGAIIDQATADYLQLNIGDTLVLIGSGFRGMNAAGKFPIIGSIDVPGAGQSGLVYLPLEEAQWLYRTGGRVTSVLPVIGHSRGLDELIEDAQAQLDTSAFDILKWQEMIPELVEGRAFDDGSSFVVMGILYMLIAFGIFGTILMMLKERTYEMGILNALGMKKSQLTLLLWMEILLIGMIGVLVGSAIIMPIVYYYNANPIQLGGDMAQAYEQFDVEAVMMTSNDPSIFITQAVIIFIMVSLMALFPFFKIRAMKLIEALRG